MNLLDDDKAKLGVALNEADVLGVELAEDRRVVSITFAVLSLPLAGPPPEDRRVQFLLHPVGRVAASYRQGRWDDSEAEVTRFEPRELLQVVQRFGGLPVYGWEFFDVHEKDFVTWRDRLSMDWKQGEGGMSHSLSLFQEGPEAHLDLCIWFDSFEIRTASGEPVSLDEFCDGGRRWWDAVYAGDPRTDGHGIVPLGEDG